MPDSKNNSQILVVIEECSPEVSRFVAWATQYYEMDEIAVTNMQLFGCIIYLVEEYDATAREATYAVATTQVHRYLTDAREKYKEVSEDVITDEELTDLALGMTKSIVDSGYGDDTQK